MTLTSTTLRFDLKCGNGAISAGKKCTKGPATEVQAEQSKSAQAKKRKVQKNLRSIAGIGAIALGTGIALGVHAERSRNNQQMSDFTERVMARARAVAQRTSRIERQQREAARSVENATDFMRGYGASTRHSTAARSPSPRGEYSPTEGSTEWKISQAFKAKIKRNTKPHKNSNPDVSAAFKSYRDSIWAEGFEP